jgi:signal peptidase I
LRVSSSSMAPVLRAGDEITVEAVSPRRLGAGDIVVFRSEINGLVVHRLVWRDKPLGRPSRLYTKGDALDRFDLPVTPEQVLGRVVSVLRGGHRFVPTTVAGRIRCLGLAAARGSRRMARRLAGRNAGAALAARQEVR